jgi:hypothetical protein
LPAGWWNKDEFETCWLLLISQWLGNVAHKVQTIALFRTEITQVDSHSQSLYFNAARYISLSLWTVRENTPWVSVSVHTVYCPQPGNIIFFFCPFCVDGQCCMLLFVYIKLVIYLL